MPDMIYSRVEFKWVLHKSTYNWLFKMFDVWCFERFCVTVVIKINLINIHICETVSVLQCMIMNKLKYKLEHKRESLCI
jgi:hypothetical protein